MAQIVTLQRPRRLFKPMKHSKVGFLAPVPPVAQAAERHLFPLTYYFFFSALVLTYSIHSTIHSFIPGPEVSLLSSYFCLSLYGSHKRVAFARHPSLCSHSKFSFIITPRCTYTPVNTTTIPSVVPPLTASANEMSTRSAIPLYWIK